MKRIVLAAAATVAATLVFGCGQPPPAPAPPPAPQPPPPPPSRQQYSSPPAMAIDPGKSYTAIIDTNYGKITAQLLPQEAPVTVNNFVFLAKQAFYNGVKIHRIVKGFVIQTGDPRGDGTGGSGYKFNDEKIVRDYKAGTLAMANSGPNTNGSQFFITLADLSGKLPKNYTIFGAVTGGFDVVLRIGELPVTRSGGENSKPTVDVHVNSVTIQEG